MTTMTTILSATIVEKEDQYSLSQIIGIWAAAAVPMGILGWVVAPALAPDFTTDPMGAGTVRFLVLTAGLIWQFILSMILVYREEGDLRWSTIRRCLRLNMPRDPKTGQPRGRLFLWVIPIIILLHLSGAFIFPALDDL